MDIHELLARCLESEIRLATSNGELRVHYDRAQPDAGLLALLREHKQELLCHLVRQTGRAVEANSIPRLPTTARERVLASPAQRRMCLMDRLDKSVAPYNMVGAYRLHGEFDDAAMGAALDEVVSRHEALRSVYAQTDGEFWQVVKPPQRVAWNCVDMSGVASAEQDAELQQLLECENNWHFALADGSLMRATKVKLGHDAWALLLNTHHIACDGWSIGILRREIAELYAAFAAGTPTQLQPLRLQYVDYAEWQRLRESETSQGTHLDYWKAKLAGMPQLHSLPLDKPRPPVQAYAAATVRRTMSGAWLQAVNAQCQTSGVTLFMYLCAALTALLSLYANERDIVVGFPVAGRGHSDLENIVGLFVNTLVLRSEVKDNPSFQELLATSRQAVIEALQHQDTPYDTLIDAIRPERSRAHSPLVQILLVLQNQAEAEFPLAGLQVTELDNRAAPVKFDLQLEATQSATGLTLDWRFSHSLFLSASIARMADSFVRLLDAVVDQPELRLYSLPLAPVNAAPKSQGLGDAATESISPRLEERFERHAIAHPERVAVALGAASLTYAELDRRANALAALLQTEGIQRGARVGLCTHCTSETIIGMLGILKAGAAYVPLDPAYPFARLDALVADSAIDLLLTQKSLVSELMPLGKQLVQLDDESIYATHCRAAPSSYSSADPAYVIYTSGTTGAPKGVVVAHAGVCNLLDHFDALSPLAAPWSGSLWSSISFDVSVYEIFSVLCNGGSLHIVPSALRLAPEQLFRWIDELGIVSIFLHASYLEPLIDYLDKRQGNNNLRRMLVGVEPIASDHLQAITQRLPLLRIINGYGPTEASVCCSLFPFDTATHAPGTRVPIGRAVQGMTLYVMNAGGEPAPHGAVGELYVGGIGLALGYLNNPVLNEARFVTKALGASPVRLYRTGDLVRYRVDGELEFIGRADQQIKLRGFRIEPGEIEIMLCRQPEISDAVVVAHGEAAGRQLIAYVVPKQEYLVIAMAGDAFAAQVRHELRQFLPEYMVPAAIVPVAAIPLTTNGKVNHAGLPAPFNRRAEVDRIAPSDETEQRLIAIWKDVLSIEDIGVTDDFFSLGGQSLLATRLIGRVRREFEIEETELLLGDLFENPTIRNFARVTDRAVQQEQTRKKALYLASLQNNVVEGTF